MIPHFLPILFAPDFIIQSIKLSRLLTELEQSKFKIVISAQSASTKTSKSYLGNNESLDTYFSKKKKTSKFINEIKLNKNEFKEEPSNKLKQITAQDLNLQEIFPTKSNNKRINELIDNNKIETTTNSNTLDANLITPNLENQNIISEISIGQNFILQNNLDTNLKKTNKQLFSEIQREIINLRNQGKDDEIFSESEKEEENHPNNLSSNQKDKNSTILPSNNIGSQPIPNSISNFSQSSLSTQTSQEILTSSYKKANFFAFNIGSSQTNPNEHITSELDIILEYHSNENNVFESIAYRKAIAQLKNAKEKITSCEQLKKYKYLGKSIGNKIKEILLTGKLKKTEYLNNDEKNRTIKLLTSVWGIGMGQANKLYRKGIKSIADLRINQDLLQQNQKVGLKYFEDLQIRIPREEIENIFSEVKKQMLTILPENILISEVAGSYRRGKATCGDIDILITRSDNDGINGILNNLVQSLMKEEIVSEILSLSEGYNKSTFMGICKYKDTPNRRIDIKVYRNEHFPFAMLYFTGSAYFNRSMRLFSRKVGYHLSDYYLKSNEGDIIYCKNEEEIFSFLGVDYKAPNERDI